MDTSKGGGGELPSTDARFQVLRRLSAGLAHDLRTPMTIIRNSLYILRHLTKANPEIVEQIKLIDTEIEEMNTILINLNDITHGQEPELTEIDFEDLVNRVIERVDGKRQANWKLDIRERSLRITCDCDQFDRVLENVLRNALRATQGLGEITISAWAESGNTVIEIRDSGCGISPEIRDSIFEPMFSTKKTGLGLGLTYCLEILKRHGGTIELADSSSSGSTFRISIPR